MSAEPLQVETDVLVIGSGAAGIYAAIEAARGGESVTPPPVQPLASRPASWRPGA